MRLLSWYYFRILQKKLTSQHLLNQIDTLQGFKTAEKASEPGRSTEGLESESWKTGAVGHDAVNIGEMHVHCDSCAVLYILPTIAVRLLLSDRTKGRNLQRSNACVTLMKRREDSTY
jgi:hypothetical protein